MLGPHFYGIDLMRMPADEWCCFGANTSPGYSCFESGRGQLISAALARFMMEADLRPSPSRELAGRDPLLSGRSGV
jgi:hypothetical protein